MAKLKSTFVCSECGYESGKWLGKCPGCGEWNTISEFIESSGGSNAPVRLNIHPQHLRDVQTAGDHRASTGMAELDRVLGGGVVPASLILISGDPGIGKSTLLLQVSQHMARTAKVLYISSEESAPQIKMRALRLGADAAAELFILSETGMDEILSGIESIQPTMVIVDSIQTVYTRNSTSAPGSVSQVRACATLLMQKAKSSGFSVFLVGHVTKEGAIAGPKVLEHLVDTVLYFEGERHHSYRILRAVKNRFGSTNEVGIFEMRDNGLFGIEDVSGLLMGRLDESTPGSAVLCSIEGTRPMLVEIQALVSTTVFGNPRRVSNGMDYNRMVMILAVLEKRLGLATGNQDAYLNVAGGLHLDEPAADLAAACALASSLTNSILRPKTVIIGEIGLTGEVRPVNRLDLRLAECAKLGFEHCIVPAGCSFPKHTDLRVHPVSSVRQAFDVVLA